MSDNIGWIKLSRNIVDMKGYFGEKFTRVQSWIDLLLLAEWKPERSFYIRGNKVTVRRGQLATSIRDLSERWGISVNTVQKRLKEFVKDRRIDIQKSNVINIISILNYEKYQSDDTQNNTQSDTQIDTQNDTQTDTPYKNINKINNNVDVDSARETEKNRTLNIEYFQRYFDESKRQTLETLLMQLHQSNPETRTMEQFKALAWQVISEWEQNEEAPKSGYTEWSKKLISQIRIKNKAQNESSNTNRAADRDAAAKAQRDAEFARYIADKLARGDMQGDVQDWY